MNLHPTVKASRLESVHHLCSSKCLPRLSTVRPYRGSSPESYPKVKLSLVAASAFAHLHERLVGFVRYTRPTHVALADYLQLPS